MSRYFDIVDGFTLLGFLGVIGVFHWLFSYFLELDYFEWYLRNGANITWAMSLFALIWGDLNKLPFLISSRPSEYAGGYASILSEVFLTLAGLGVVKPKSEPPITSYWVMDQLIGMAVSTIFSILILSWVVVIAPIQYFFFIICGAPARIILCSQQKIEGSDTKWWSVSLSEKPVAVTAAFTGMILWILKFFLVKG